MATVTRHGQGRKTIERGQSIIEMALVLPLLLLVVVGIIDFALMFQRYEVLTNAAVEGARVAILPGYSSADAQARVIQYATNGGIPGTVTANVQQVSLPGAGGGTWPGTQVTATHTYNYQFIGPIVGLFSGSFAPSVQLTARSTMRNQVAAGGGS
jgi:Flp pilus assembly protein TadG